MQTSRKVKCRPDQSQLNRTLNICYINHIILVIVILKILLCLILLIVFHVYHVPKPNCFILWVCYFVWWSHQFLLTSSYLFVSEKVYITIFKKGAYPLKPTYSWTEKDFSIMFWNLESEQIPWKVKSFHITLKIVDNM